MIPPMGGCGLLQGLRSIHRVSARASTGLRGAAAKCATPAPVCVVWFLQCLRPGLVRATSIASILRHPPMFVEAARHAAHQWACRTLTILPRAAIRKPWSWVNTAFAGIGERRAPDAAHALSVNADVPRQPFGEGLPHVCFAGRPGGVSVGILLR